MIMQEMQSLTAPVSDFSLGLATGICIGLALLLL